MFHNVFVPVDGSEFAENAVPWAVAVAASGGHLHLVHAHCFPPPDSGLITDPNLDRALRTQEDQYLNELAAKVRTLSPHLTVTTQNADICPLPTEALGVIVGKNRADLVVMATHGRGMLARFFLGSVSQQFAKQSPVPVLLIPGKMEPGTPQLDEWIVPLDGSAFAEQILAPAAALASAFRCRCTLAYVAESATESEAYLEQVARSLPSAVAIYRKIIRDGSVAEAILAQTGDNPRVGIALATHGRTGISRLLSGSVADEVVRRAAGPVLLLRPASATA